MPVSNDESWKRVDTIEVSGPAAVIGDVHGRLDLLVKLASRLDGLHPAGKMPLFFVGDLVDRGPDSRGVVEFLAARGARGVRGNHEDWFVRYANGGGFDGVMLRPHLGGRATLDSYGIDSTSTRTIEADRSKVPAAHREWLTGLPLVLRLSVDGKPFWLVHAGVGGDAVTVEEPVARMHELVVDDPDSLLWPSRSLDDMATLDGPVIFGHTPIPEPVDAGHAIAVDTGSGVWDDGSLTAVVLPRRRFVSVRP